jgi:cyanate permease
VLRYHILGRVAYPPANNRLSGLYQSGGYTRAAHKMLDLGVYSLAS